MRFSVVIPTCNRPDLLSACLERLAPGRQTLAATEYEVIVTDDGAKRPAAQNVGERFPWVRWTIGPRRGPAGNRNNGAKLATGEWLVFTDDDCVPAPQWLGAYASAVEKYGASAEVLEGRTYVDRPRAHPLEFSPVNTNGGRLWSCNFAIRRALFDEVGGFDERFQYNAMEDVELHVRLQQRSATPIFVRDAAVLHPWRRIDDWPRHAERHLASRLLLESIHPGTAFPVPWYRVMRAHSRVVLTEHVPWLAKRPIDMARVLPQLWRSMAEDVWVTWRRRGGPRVKR